MHIDNLNTQNAREAVQAAYAGISALQHLPPATQVAAIAVLFETVRDTLGINPSELGNKAQRWCADADTYYTTEIRALREYIREEIR